MTQTGINGLGSVAKPWWQGLWARLLIVVAVGALTVGALSVAMPGPSPMSATCTFTTVGTTKTLHEDCTTDATIPILDGYTLDGAGHTITAVDPPGGHFVGAVVASTGAVAYVRDLHVTTSGLANVCDEGTLRLRGILFDGASGSITDTIVTNINQGASGCQEGNGIEVRNAPFDGTHPATKTIEIAGNVVTGYQKTGIVANGDVSVEATGNTVVGLGPVPYIAQNGIQLGFGATGEVRGNDISGNDYTGCSNQDAAETGCTPWVSAALLLYDVDAHTVRHSMNTYRDNQRNLVLITSSSLANP